MPIEGDRMKVQYQYQTDLGMLYIVQEDDAIAEVVILQPNQIIPYETKETSLIQNAYQQLKEYFSFSSGQESGAQKKNLLLPRFHRQQLTLSPFYLKRFAPF